MVHNPKHKVHSFRGFLGDGGQNTIELNKQNNNVAYRIVKFEIMSAQPFENQESIATIWREKQTTIPIEPVNFTDTDILGVAMWKSASASAVLFSSTIIFDNVLFSRNIYVTHTEHTGSEYLNYYIEIEEVPVGSATLMQLKLGTARKLIGAKMGA